MDFELEQSGETFDIGFSSLDSTLLTSDAFLEKSTRTLSKNSASFLWYQLIIDVLRQFPRSNQAKQDLVAYCQKYYEFNNNNIELELIKRFDETYTPEKAIYWYTQECFLYKLMNKAFRTEDVELIYLFRLYIIDLCAALEKQYQLMAKNELLILYRGQRLTKGEVESMQQNPGMLISVNGFLSTSRIPDVALNYCHPKRQSDNRVNVLFEIIVDHEKVNNVIFADIQFHSSFDNEREVLFGLGTVFQIHSCDYDAVLNLWKVKMHATDEGLCRVQEYICVQSKEIEDITPTVLFGVLLYRDMGAREKAEKYFNHLLASLPSDSDDIDFIYNNLGSIYKEKQYFDLALHNYERAYNIRLLNRKIEKYQKRIAASLINIGSLHSIKGNTKLAIQYLNEALEIQDKLFGNADHLNKMIALVNLGWILQEEQDFDAALIFSLRAHEMCSRLFPKDHPRVADSLESIGSIYQAQKQFSLALKQYTDAYKIRLVVHLNNHQKIHKSLITIMELYKEWNRRDEGVSYFQDELHSQETKDECESVLTRGFILNAMGLLEESRDTFVAVEYYKQALDVINDQISTDAKLLRAATFINMGDAYQILKSYQLAQDHFEKACRIRISLWSSKHISVADVFWRIGFVHREQQHGREALKYFHEAFNIEMCNYGLIHLTLETGIRNIASIYKDIDEVHAGIEFCIAQIQIRREQPPENHPFIARITIILVDLFDDVIDCLQYLSDALNLLEYCELTKKDKSIMIDCLLRIGVEYGSRNNYETSLKYNQRALELAENLYEIEDHSKHALCLHVLGLTYSELGNRELAIRYLEKALIIFEKINDKDYTEFYQSTKTYLQEFTNEQVKCESSIIQEKCKTCNTATTSLTMTKLAESSASSSILQSESDNNTPSRSSFCSLF